MNQEFHDKLAAYSKQNQGNQVNILVMSELGKIMVKNRKDFVDLLNECGIFASEQMTDAQLVDLYINNIVNQKLLLGSAFLVNLHNKQMNADGESEVSDEGVKVCYDCLMSSFAGDDESNFSDEEQSNFDVKGLVQGAKESGFGQGTAQGAAGGGPVGAIFGAVGDVAKLGAKGLESRDKKKYGAQDAMAKKAEARNAMVQQVLAQRQAEVEAKKKKDEQKQKTTRTILIVSGVVVGLLAIGLTIYLIKKKKASGK